MPTGHVLRWHFLIIVHPMAIRGAVLKPNSSAPSMAAITTSRPRKLKDSNKTLYIFYTELGGSFMVAYN